MPTRVDLKRGRVQANIIIPLSTLYTVPVPVQTRSSLHFFSLTLSLFLLLRATLSPTNPPDAHERGNMRERVFAGRECEKGSRMDSATPVLVQLYVNRMRIRIRNKDGSRPV